MIVQQTLSPSIVNVLDKNVSIHDTTTRKYHHMQKKFKDKYINGGTMNGKKKGNKGILIGVFHTM